MHKSGLLLKILVTLLIMPPLVYLAEAGIADFLRLRACNYIDSLRSGAHLDPVELDRSREYLLKAHGWDVRNPVITEYLAQTDFAIAQLVPFIPVMQANFLHNAISNLELAIASRPNSAYLSAARMTMGSWLLEIRSGLGGHSTIDDIEFQRIQIELRRAAQLDPWEPSVLLQIVKVGKFRYKEFSLDDQVIIDKAIARAVQLKIIS